MAGSSGEASEVGGQGAEGPKCPLPTDTPASPLPLQAPLAPSSPRLHPCFTPHHQHNCKTSLTPLLRKLLFLGTLEAQNKGDFQNNLMGVTGRSFQGSQPQDGLSRRDLGELPKAKGCRRQRGPTWGQSHCLQSAEAISSRGREIAHLGSMETLCSLQP